MPINQFDNTRLKRICMHEAGHLIIAKEMKFQTHGIKLTIFQGKGHDAISGITLWTQDINTIERLINFIKRRLNVLFAGVLSEFMLADGTFNTIMVESEWKDGGAIDYAKIRELLQTLRNISHPKTNEERFVSRELQDLRNVQKQEAVEIVAKRYSVIEAISNTLYKKVKEYDTIYEITEEEICSIPEVVEFLREINQ